MRRQLLATAAAISTTLALAVAVPAFADHEDPVEVPDNPTCEDLGFESIEDGKVEFNGDQPTVIEDLEDFFDPEDFDLDAVTAVIVKGGNSANLYTIPPFHDLVAPDGKEISHVEICTGEVTPPPTNGETTPTNGETTPTNGETTPVDETTPAKVPTEVPAGVNGEGGSAGLVGLIIAASAAAAGFVLLARRRALHDS
jgi:hypothetical protein